MKVDDTTTNTVYNRAFKKGELDGSLVTTSVDGPAGFIGGAGYVTGGLEGTGEFDLNPLSGDFEGTGAGSGPFAIGAIGAAATNGDADFNAELSGAKTTETTSTVSTLVDNETITRNILESSGERGYTYDFHGEGVFGFRADLETRDVYTYIGLRPQVQDALEELNEAKDVAMAVGNMISVEGDVPVQEHSGQFLFDTHEFDRKCEQSCGVREVDFEDADFDLDADLSLNDRERNHDTENHFHDLALLLGLAAGAGLIDQANIKAESSVYNIMDLTGSASATAIGNLKTIDVDTNNINNGLVMADVTQMSVANVSADAQAYNISIMNYTNLGGLDRAIASSTATAIGNSLGITVSSGQTPPQP